MNQSVRDALCDMGHEDTVLFDRPDYDDAIIGVTDEGQAIYDFDAMVNCLVASDGISEEEAIEFIEYNTIRALPFAGEKAPIIMYKLMT